VWIGCVRACGRKFWVCVGVGACIDVICFGRWI
jgi:hypothetical protein